ncbi:MAG TPA: Bax inhibitor-1 family protein [Streptosporangiaceae bacterium]|nr:Bax inhibitor-1 family protein [Streptosporangiaceae bacterium]
MQYTPSYVAPAQVQARTLFGNVMWLVALTAGCFALGCYAGRNLSPGWSIIWWIAGFACLIGLNFARRASSGVSIALLMLMGLCLGLGLGPVVTYYSTTSPRAVWQAAGATALFIAGCGSFGYATRRDLSALGRISFFALLALIVAGIILVFVHIPGADLAFSILGLVIFAGLTMFDFQRLRRSQDAASAPFIAASIFLDALNVFLFFLRLFGGRD